MTEWIDVPVADVQTGDEVKVDGIGERGGKAMSNLEPGMHLCRCGHRAEQHRIVWTREPAPCGVCVCPDYNYKPAPKPAEPPACLPGCRPVYSVRIMSGPIQGDQIDHWPNCPNTPKLAAEPPACRICGKAPAWNGGDWCRDCSRGKGEPAKYEEIASERHSYILLEAERQRLYDGNAALRAQLRTTMTDPKPAPPATDDCICEDVRVLGACPVHEPRSTEPANDDLVAAWLADLQGMDDADREHDVTVLDTRSLLYRIAADAETIRKQAQEIKRLTSNVERLEGDGRFVAFELSDELATLREQVRTLREALKAALGHCDCSDYRGMALIPCTAANPCAGCYTTRTGQAALAATEPKG